MSSHTHKRILRAINILGRYPDHETQVTEWLSGLDHISLIRDNRRDDELILYASSQCAFVHTVAVPNTKLHPTDKDDLLGWQCNAHTLCASIWWQFGEEEKLGFTRGISGAGSKTLEGGQNLIFIRSFDGWNGEDNTSLELLQEFEHVAEIRLREERNAYCKIDENGDFYDAVSVTKKTSTTGTTLVTAKIDELIEYLVSSDQTLIQMFDFSLLDRAQFKSWDGGEEKTVFESDTFFWRQKVCDDCAYFRGVQILRPNLTKKDLFEKLTEPSIRDADSVGFIAIDWRNGCVAEISTAIGATTNYFEMENNNLPHQLSPAFFRPEVLSKYKSDKDKYTVGDRDIYCRSSWRLRGYDVNEAGQVHAYICDLSDLPYQEQLHWKSFNVEPEASISKRAFTNDFKGEWWTETNPFQSIFKVAQDWDEQSVWWWKLKETVLIENKSLPLSDSRNEWAETFMDLTKLLNEGFAEKSLKKVMLAHNIEFGSSDRSLVLLEKFLSAKTDDVKPIRLNGLRIAQEIRSKVKGHAGSSDALKLAKTALMQHGTFAAHVQHVSAEILQELEMIENKLSEV
ncbi:MAG: hypothetical protein AAGF20_07565 [Pseudomonadota bacterium]